MDWWDYEEDRSFLPQVLGRPMEDFFFKKKHSKYSAKAEMLYENNSENLARSVS